MTIELDQAVEKDVAPPARRLPGARRAVANQEPAAAAPDPTPVPPEPDPVPAAGPPAVDDWNRFGEPESRSPVAILTAPEKPAPATWGRRRVLVRILSVGLAQPKPGAQEVEYRANRKLIRTTTWGRSVRVMVANPKGGVGKTPTALVLGGMFAEEGRPTVIWDAADARGDLTERAEGAPAKCVSWVADAPGDYRVPGTIGALTAKQSSFADVLGSLTAREFDADSIDRVTWSLDRTYQVQVADTGNVAHSPAFQKAIELADLLVIPTTVTAGSVHAAVRLLERLQGTGLTANAVVALMRYGGPETPGLLPQIPGIFEAVGVGAIVDIPFDPVIARGTAIDTRALSRPSRLAWTRLAAAVATNIRTR